MIDQLDETSRAILQALQENARISFAELGKHVGLTAPAVAERVRKMEDAGIISGYHAAVNLSALGLPISVVIQLRINHGRSKELVAMVRDMPEVTTCYNLTGNDCFMVVASVASIAHLEKLLEILGSYGQTTTSIVLSTPVKRRVICRKIDLVTESTNNHKNWDI
ncbi:MAG: AsnC family transcriptional regulator [Chloroflexi bacterium HGW-Chloroflexi-10]|nr:MAG: AsnC family transcriptional regulator [Chloroflexi bacterium HGW-Chloroflexi-10]